MQVSGLNVTAAYRTGILLACCAIVAWACGGSPKPPAVRPCTAIAVDSSWLAAGPVYQNCEVDTPARMTVPRVDYRPPLNECGQTYQARVSFVLDTLGQVEANTVRLVAASPRAYGAAVAAAVTHAHGTPAQKAGQKVRQLAQITLAMEQNPAVCR